MVFYIKNCKITTEFSFFLIFAFSLLLRTKSVLYVLLFASLHEFGHILMLRVFGYLPDSITVSFYGISMKHSANLNMFSEILFLLSGVAINVLFAVFDIHKEINIPLAAINILPVVPLDGGRVLSLFVNERIMRILSVITIVLLLIYSIIIANYSLILICVYIIIYSYFEGI